jgi:hypothetical protein
MGMSIDGGSNLDVQTILAGGSAFMSRLEQWKTAKEEHDRSYERLGIGQNVAAEMDKAARMTAEARLEAEAISKQALEAASKSQRTLNEFVATAKDEANRAMRAAQEKEAEADRRLAAAKEAHAAADAKLAEADDRLGKAKAAHEAVLAASAALNKAVG